MRPSRWRTSSRSSDCMRIACGLHADCVPHQVENELSVIEKEISERFIQDVIFDLSDYFLCVVNDFTSLDQRYLDQLTRSLQNSKKHFQEVIVVHNCKTVMEQEVMDHIFHSQIE